MDNLQSENKPLRSERVFLWGFSIGFGAVIGISLIIGGILWYQSRPKPWNKSAIIATFDQLDTEGEENTVRFCYILENRTDTDYELTSATDCELMVRLTDPSSLLPSTASASRLEYLPLFLAAKQRLAVTMTWDYSFPNRIKEDATKEERQSHREQIAKWLNEKAGNLNGFVLFDKRNRYEITLPKGW